MSTDSILLPNFYYVGNFDDEIRRYNAEELTLDTINDTLFQAVIAGGPLLINDGYLMHYPEGRRALTDSSASPLIHLLKAGFVRLFSRTGGNLADMPKKMEHIPTYANLLKSEEWKGLWYKLLNLQTALPNAIVDWPRKDVGPGFCRLMKFARNNLQKGSLPAYVHAYRTEDLFNEFERLLAGDSRLAARSTWNQLLDQPDFQFSQPEKEYLHWIGIEAYHYNMAMVASVAFGNRPSEYRHFQQPGVLTRYSTLFSEFQLNLVEDEHGTPLDELPMPMVPKGFYESAMRNGDFLARIIDPGSTLNNLKQDYLRSLHAAIEDRHHLQDARNASDLYEAELSHVWIHEYPNREENFKWLSVVVSASLGSLGAAVTRLDPVGGALMGAMVQLTTPHLVQSARETIQKVFRPQVQLAIKLIQLPEERRPKLDTLSTPIPSAKWSAFMPVDIDQAIRHFDSLPPLQ